VSQGQFGDSVVMKNRQVVTDESHISGGVVLVTEGSLPIYLGEIDPHARH